MANPTKPDIDYSYAGFQQEFQDNPFPGTQLDNDLAELETSIDETIDALADIRRADGALQNSIVTADSLDESLLIGLKTPTVWTAGTRYVVLDTVIANVGIYRCLVSHESADFDDEFTAGYWQLIFELSPTAPANLPSYQFVGDGVTTDWPIGTAPGTLNNVFVSVGGSFQISSEIALIAGATNYIRISPAVAAGVAIEIRTLVATVVLNVPVDGSVGRAQLDAEVTASVELADSALQPAAIGTTVQAFDLDLAAIAALVTSADQLPYATGAGTWALTSLSTFGRSLIDDADAAAARATLGLGTAAVVATGTSGATIPLLNAANAWSGVQTIALANAVPLAVSRTGSANNASISYTTTGGTIFAGTADGTDWAIGISNNLFGASTFFKINVATATFSTDVALASNKAISFAGTGAATTRANLGLVTGTYTPTLTNTTNIAASTPYVCQYMQVGNVVTVSGKVDIDVTAAGNALLGMSLPVASALTTDIQVGGTFVSNAAATPEAGCIFADGTNDRASFKFIAVNTANNTFFFSFTYLVL